MEHEASGSFSNECHGEAGRSWETTEPRLAEILGDPIIQALMASDGVDPQQLMRSLCEAPSRSPLPAPDGQSRDFEKEREAASSRGLIVGSSPAGDPEKN
jgi:hypothetical protein